MMEVDFSASRCEDALALSDNWLPAYSRRIGVREEKPWRSASVGLCHPHVGSTTGILVSAGNGIQDMRVIKPLELVVYAAPFTDHRLAEGSNIQDLQLPNDAT